MQLERIRKLKELEVNPDQNKCVVYWITREYRTNYNYSLLYAQQIANKYNKPLVVLINLNEEKTIDYTIPFNFFIDGLFDLINNLKVLNIPVHFNNGNSKKNIPLFLNKINASVLITDFFPLKYYQKLTKQVIENINFTALEVDSHNIVPVRTASQKQEFGAYTIRPKIHKLLAKYLVEIPKVKYHTQNSEEIIKHCNADFTSLITNYNSTNSISWLKSGENNAIDHLEFFINNRLDKYSIDRNNPVIKGISDLSPYIHFGHISTQHIALEINKSDKNKESIDSFLEEMIVRRELSDNFCFYNTNYDNFDGAHQWAKTTLNEHRADKREFIYSTEEFEFAKTLDPAWNAAQIEMVRTGKMHGYMRMYWAKKILEWTNSPEEAISIAIYLNDKYELDGYDPNGYVGVMWSICGTHDRAWSERPIFGKIRYMNYAGLKRKIDITAYQNKWLLENIL